jgi:hypothetical protein
MTGEARKSIVTICAGFLLLACGRPTAPRSSMRAAGKIFVDVFLFWSNLPEKWAMRCIEPPRQRFICSRDTDGTQRIGSRSPSTSLFFSPHNSTLHQSVKLFELVKLMIEQTSGFHARALRVIGQDLAALLPENVAIELDGNRFVAHGLCAKTRIEDQTPAEVLTRVKKLFGKMAAAIIGPATRAPDLEFGPFTRTYNVDDIDHLDGEGTDRRGHVSDLPDIYTLGGRLRTIGKVIDAHNGRIIRIFKDLHQIVFEYRDADGQTRKEELNNTELYQLQQRYASERGGVIVSESAK